MATDISLTLANHFVVSAGDTDATRVAINRGGLNKDLPKLILLLVEADADNSGTIKVNGLGEPTAESVELAAGEQAMLTIASEFWVEQSVGADELNCSW